MSFDPTKTGFSPWISENGRQISRRTYNKHIDRKFNYIMNHMSEQDKNVLKYMKIDKRVKDSLIYIYDNH